MVGITFFLLLRYSIIFYILWKWIVWYCDIWKSYSKSMFRYFLWQQIGIWLTAKNTNKFEGIYITLGHPKAFILFCLCSWKCRNEMSVFTETALILKKTLLLNNGKINRQNIWPFRLLFSVPVRNKKCPTTRPSFLFSMTLVTIYSRTG